jgi:hypothetical protein
MSRYDEVQAELSKNPRTWLVGGVLRERIAPLATAGSDRLGRLRDLAEHSGTAKIFPVKRVRQLTTWRKRLRLVLPVLDTLLGPKEG